MQRLVNPLISHVFGEKNTFLLLTIIFLPPLWRGSKTTLKKVLGAPRTPAKRDYSETRLIRIPRGHAKVSVLSGLSEKHGKTSRTRFMDIKKDERLKQTFLRQQDVVKFPNYKCETKGTTDGQLTLSQAASKQLFYSNS